jgi:subtilisin family serine protease
MKRPMLLSLVIGLLLLVSFSKGQSSHTVAVIDSVSPFQNVRWKDLRKIEKQLDSSIIKTFWFNESTLWPEKFKGYARSIIEKGKNPGLGVRGLHKQGITGKGVTVAIIDQNICLDHPEFAGKIIEYHDVGCDQDSNSSSMHGPAVTSILVGETIGTAPGAKLYYAAVPTWELDAQNEANALNWIINKNITLSQDQKIKVVSISEAPSGPNTNFKKNCSAWDSACARAARAGILVLDCTGNHGITTFCYNDLNDPDNITKCTPSLLRWKVKSDSTRLCAPMSYRTVAEEYSKDTCSYQYTAEGGLSWTVPYVAGICALGWQINPNLSGDMMVRLLHESAFCTQDGRRIIQPSSFIELVKKMK